METIHASTEWSEECFPTLCLVHSCLWWVSQQTCSSQENPLIVAYRQAETQYDRWRVSEFSMPEPASFFIPAVSAVGVGFVYVLFAWWLADTVFQGSTLHLFYFVQVLVIWNMGADIYIWYVMRYDNMTMLLSQVPYLVVSVICFHFHFVVLARLYTDVFWTQSKYQWLELMCTLVLIGLASWSFVPTVDYNSPIAMLSVIALWFQLVVEFVIWVVIVSIAAPSFYLKLIHRSMLQEYKMHRLRCIVVFCVQFALLLADFSLLLVAALTSDKRKSLMLRLVATLTHDMLPSNLVFLVGYVTNLLLVRKTINRGEPSKETIRLE
ncbi:hypothetical protein EDD86DRAFT_54329 [Gorgonomyces haynaldii]|nr:hypothetical protein EDD86DRAFT_54329 [Gorgonomyces haynaldii]